MDSVSIVRIFWPNLKSSYPYLSLPWTLDTNSNNRPKDTYGFRTCASYGTTAATTAANQPMFTKSFSSKNADSYAWMAVSHPPCGWKPQRLSTHSYKHRFTIISTAWLSARVSNIRACIPTQMQIVLMCGGAQISGSKMGGTTIQQVRSCDQG